MVSAAEMPKVGTLVKGHRHGAVTVFDCSQGGVAWPEHLAFYDGNHRSLGHVDLAFLGAGEGPDVRRITIRKRVITVQVVGVHEEGDADCCGPLSARLTYKYNQHKRKVVRTSKRIYGVGSAAVALGRAWSSHAVPGIERHLTRPGVSSLSIVQAVDGRLEAVSTWGAVSLDRCYGALDGGSGEFTDISGDTSYPLRVCFYDETGNDGRALEVAFKQTSWKTWKGLAINIAG
jgi:hypothetical protein